MLETATITMASSFDCSLPVSKFDKFENGKSVWDAHRSIWQDKSAEPESSRPNSARHNSTSSNKFSKAINGSTLSTIDNPRNNSTDLNVWGGSNGNTNNNQANNFLSPTKRKQSGWLFDSKSHDVENTSNLLAGSAPEFEPFGDHGQDPTVLSRPLRLPDDSLTYDNRFAPSLRSTGPSQFPAPNRFLPQTNGVSQGTQQLRKSSDNSAVSQDYRSRNDLGLSTNVSPPASRGLAADAVRPNSNAVSPTSRFQRDMQGYLQRTVDEATEGFRSLNINKGPSGYDKFSHTCDTTLPTIHNEDEIALWNNTYNNGGYARTHPYYDQHYIEQHNTPAWLHWEHNDAKVRPDQVQDYRNSPSSPYHSSSLTPSSGSDSIRSAVASRNSHHDMIVTTRRAVRQDGYYQPAYMNNGMLVPQGVIPMDMARGHMNPLAPPYCMSSYLTGPKCFLPRDDLRPVVQRSAFLEEFRMHKSTKRYELRDLFGYIVEFSGDQHGSRFIQHKLETANSDEKDQVFKEIQYDALPLMTDVFGNYVIQKLFEHGSQSQKRMLAEHMKGQVLFLSTQMYGCRVVQKALEHVLTDQQASMVKELDGPNKAILKTIKDQNGNHVVQKAIERVPAEHIEFIIDAHKGEAVKLAQHTYGCRVIQRILEFCTPTAKRIILDELHVCVAPLITDQFGNYVIQHVISKGEPEDRRRVVSIVMQQLMHFSKHKFASNVVEKSLEYADEDQQARLFATLVHPDASGMSPVFALLRDQYGNYVIQKVLGLLKGPQREILESEMRACFSQLKRTSYGKQVIAIEKLLYGGSQPLAITHVAHNNGQMVVRTNKR